MKRAVIALAIIFALMLGSFVVFAQQTYHDELIIIYSFLKGSKIDKTCLCCHFIQEGTGPRNPYGVMYENTDELGDFEEFEKYDADGDGYTNIQELKAKTYPGDFNDHPSPTKFKKCVTFFAGKESIKKIVITVCVASGKSYDLVALGGAVYEKSGTIMIPWKAIVENLGGTGVFNAKDKKGRLDIKKAGKLVAQLWVGQTKGKLNGKDNTFKVAPEMKGKFLFVSGVDIAKILTATEQKIARGKIYNYTVK